MTEKLAVDDVDTDGLAEQPDRPARRVPITITYTGAYPYFNAVLLLGSGGGGGGESAVEVQLNYLEGGAIALSPYARPVNLPSAWHERRHMRLFFLLFRRALTVWRTFFGFTGNSTIYVRVPAIGAVGQELERLFLLFTFRYERSLRPFGSPETLDYFRMVATTDGIIDLR